MKQDEREQLEVLLRKQLEEEPVTARDRADCPDPDWISAFLEGGLSPALKTSVESHISECRSCQEELALLLKTYPGEPVKQEEIAQQSETQWSEWLGLGWFKPVFLKPVFAILVVALLSGVVGYKFLFEQKRGEDKATEIAGAIMKPAEPPIQNQKEPADSESGTTMNNRPALDSIQPEGKSDSMAEKPRSNQDYRAANEELRYSALQEAQSSLSKDDSRNGRTEVFREEPNKLREKEPPRKDLNDQPAAVPQAAAATAGPPPASTPALNQVMAERDSGAKEQQPMQDKKVAGQLQAGKEATGQLTGSGVVAKRAMAAKQKSNMADEVASAAKAEESKGGFSSVGAVGGALAHPRQIRLSGKTFELRQNVWVDLAIGKEGEYAPIVIRKGSSEYLELAKELSIYQDVLNHPEDCLIKLNEHVYRIQKK
jgi:hypothetical protein